MSWKKLTILSLAVMGLASCDNTLRVTAPFEDIPVVYGALDIRQDTQYIRIGRAFLGQDGPAGGRDIGDSLYPSTLDVRLIPIKTDGSLAPALQLVETFDIDKDPGVFTTDGHRVYRLVMPNHYFWDANEDATERQEWTYRLELRVGNELLATAETPLVYDLRLKKPVAIGIQKMALTASKGYSIEWFQADNARIYQGHIDFHYMEMPFHSQKDSTRHVVRYELSDVTGSTLSGNGATSKTTLNYSDFYSFLADEIPVKAGHWRWFRYCELYLTAGSDDMATYIRTTQPSNTILQDPPFFSNVEGGAGVLASRTSIRRPYLGLSTSSVDSLVFGNLTCQLNFAKASNLDTLTCN